MTVAVASEGERRESCRDDGVVHHHSSRRQLGPEFDAHHGCDPGGIDVNGER